MNHASLRQDRSDRLRPVQGSRRVCPWGSARRAPGVRSDSQAGRRCSAADAAWLRLARVTRRRMLGGNYMVWSFDLRCRIDLLPQTWLRWWLRWVLIAGVGWEIGGAVHHAAGWAESRVAGDA